MASNAKPMKHATQVRVGLPKHTLDRVRQVARDEGISVAAVIRRATIRDVGRPEPR